MVAMIRITVTPAAYEALCTGVPQDRRLPALRCPEGGYYLWLGKEAAAKLAAARRSAEGYSEAILRLAGMEG